MIICYSPNANAKIAAKKSFWKKLEKAVNKHINAKVGDGKPDYNRVIKKYGEKVINKYRDINDREIRLLLEFGLDKDLLETVMFIKKTASTQKYRKHN